MIEGKKYSQNGYEGTIEYDKILGWVDSKSRKQLRGQGKGLWNEVKK